MATRITQTEAIVEFWQFVRSIGGLTSGDAQQAGRPLEGSYEIRTINRKLYPVRFTEVPYEYVVIFGGKPLTARQLSDAVKTAYWGAQMQTEVMNGTAQHRGA